MMNVSEEMTPDDVGLNTGRLVAGFAGGIVHALAFRDTTPIGLITSIITGTLTANYLGPAAVHYIGGWIGDGGSAFAVGLSAMLIIQGVDAAIRGRMKQLSKLNGENRD